LAETDAPTFRESLEDEVAPIDYNLQEAPRSPRKSISKGNPEQSGIKRGYMLGRSDGLWQVKATGSPLVDERAPNNVRFILKVVIA
jgi:hypothetical protein